MSHQENEELLHEAIAKAKRGEDLSDAEQDILRASIAAGSLRLGLLSDAEALRALTKLKGFAEKMGSPGPPEHRGDRSALLQDALRAFRAELPELLKTYPRQWVAYGGAERIVFRATKAELMEECVQRGFRYEELLLRMVQPDIPATR